MLWCWWIECHTHGTEHWIASVPAAQPSHARPKGVIVKVQDDCTIDADDMMTPLDGNADLVGTAQRSSNWFRHGDGLKGLRLRAIRDLAYDQPAKTAVKLETVSRDARHEPALPSAR